MLLRYTVMYLRVIATLTYAEQSRLLEAEVEVRRCN
jgi:hypothetical protein